MTETKTRSLTLVRDQEIEIETLRARVAELEPLQARVAELERKLQSQREISGHEIYRLKGIFTRTLTDLRYQVECARDALEIEPPRPDFSVRYSEHAMSDIDAKLKWIKDGCK